MLEGGRKNENEKRLWVGKRERERDRTILLAPPPRISDTVEYTKVRSKDSGVRPSEWGIVSWTRSLVGSTSRKGSRGGAALPQEEGFWAYRFVRSFRQPNLQSLR